MSDKIIHSFFSKYSVLFLLGLSSSCTPEPFFEQEIKIEKGMWTYDNPIRFSWQIIDTSITYDLELQVDHEREMDFRNCYIKLKTEFPDSSLTHQVLSMELYDSSGKAFGKCSSDRCSTSLDLMGNFKFPKPGSYAISIEQFGRDSTLLGINALTLKLREIKL